MSSVLGEAAGFLNKYLVSGAISAAAGAALRPEIQDLVNEAWKLNAVVKPEPVILAQGVAQGQVSKASAYEWAKEHGYDTDVMDALVSIANVGPPLGPALEAFRRTIWTPAEYTTALNRQGIEPQWYPGLLKLKDALLSPSDVANAVQQGHMPDDGILPPFITGALPLDIPLTQIPLDSLTEALGNGITEDRLKVLANLAGLPPPQGELLTMWRRKIITEAAVEAGIREGHTKTKWTGAVKELKRTILTPVEYVDAHLRGYITEQEMYDGTDLHGLNQADTKILFESHGRPLTVHQITTGLARKGTYDGPTAGIEQVYLDSLKEGSIKPPFYNLAYANRYTLPSFFVVRALLQDHTLTETEAADLFKQEGWPPYLADAAAKAYATGGTAKANPYVTKARGFVFTALHKNYVNTPVYDAKVGEGLTLLGVSAADQATILELFKFEQTIGLAATPPPVPAPVP